ncbi:hypothetical protein BKI52_19690 [marine bacterium AO1-C]|nr:hypothetical protein BKI52_19690 [marine bacterium AO1-C]
MKQINFKRHPIVATASFANFVIFSLYVWRDYIDNGIEVPIYSGIQLLLAVSGLLMGIWTLINPHFAIIKGRYLYIYEDPFAKRKKLDLFDYIKVSHPHDKKLILTKDNGQPQEVKIHSMQKKTRAKLIKVIGKVIEAKLAKQ